jgi:glycosyltransferase involved in cell wall biosynthesis
MTPNRSPRVSIVVPAFNEPPAILAESLASVVAQTFADFECLVIDESTDLVCAVACREYCDSDPRLRYVRPPERIGLAASLNMGIDLAQGELIARFDSDDICLPDRLALQVAFFDAHPDIGVVGGALELMDEDGRTTALRRYPLSHRQIERRFHTTTAVAHPTVMMRKSLLEQYGAYDPVFRFAEDLDLWLRLLNRGVRFANLDEVLVRYRQQITRRNSGHWQFNLRARKRNLTARFLPLRLAGICAIEVWSKMPHAAQEFIFARLLLRRA